MRLEESRALVEFARPVIGPLPRVRGAYIPRQRNVSGEPRQTRAIKPQVLVAEEQKIMASVGDGRMIPRD